ncbi:superoxide dismutase family protein [Marilutibacter aestuarii]|uniref:Superoxide dismutase [Cu-Zn] n=1 Tax=Marilutibacter aestuarii TaxID=1706195 RepID=A0A508ACL6_9GAMM|nr:superoxide dismutase family protein [Lysobacter aestuarii]TQD46663.1 superoxide dismutase family protein [Lysobacter aestuarii]
MIQAAPRFRRQALATAAFASLGLLAACSTAPAPKPAPAPAPAPVSTAKAAEVILTSASASLVSGKLNVRPGADGVYLSGEVGGLSPGSLHAIHIHENGDCSAVDASSAGGHFNPAGNPHGRVGQGAHHGGDMDNINANGEGVAQVNVRAEGVTLGGGAFNDVAGRAVIVHAAGDDYTSQPSGNAGKRVACGIIQVTE